MRRKAAQQHLPEVCLSVAVRVFRVEDIRCAADQHAVAPGCDSRWKRHILQEDGRPVVASVAVGVLEKTDDAPGPAGSRNAFGIVPHLSHPQLAVRPEIDGDRIDHQRFGRRHFHSESFADIHGRNRFLWSQRSSTRCRCGIVPGCLCRGARGRSSGRRNLRGSARTMHSLDENGECENRTDQPQPAWTLAVTSGDVSGHNGLHNETTLTTKKAGGSDASGRGRCPTPFLVAQHPCVRQHRPQF